MRKLRMAAIVAVSALLGWNGAAADPPRQQDKIVCKSKPRTGTRFVNKTCRTAAEWEAIAEFSRRAAAEMVNRPVVNTERGN